MCLLPSKSRRQSYITTDGQSASLSWCQANNLGPKTRFLLLSDCCGFVDVGRRLWREDGSVVYNCRWSSPAQSYLTPTNSSQSQRQSQNYFTTDGLPPISSPWRQAPWDPRPEIFSNWTLAVIVLCNILSDEKMGLSLMNMLGLSSSIHFTHIACYWNFFLLHYTQVLCQYRLWKADHAYLAYLMLQRQLTH
jgi:hypothetical protein